MLHWVWNLKPDMLQSIGSQRVGHDWVTEQQQQILVVKMFYISRGKLYVLFSLYAKLRMTNNDIFLWQLEVKLLIMYSESILETMFSMLRN